MRWKQRRRQNHTIWRVENKKCTVPNRTLTHTHTHRPVVNKNHSKTKYNMATRSILQTIWTIVFVVKAKLKISVFFGAKLNHSCHSRKTHLTDCCTNMIYVLFGAWPKTVKWPPKMPKYFSRLCQWSRCCPQFYSILFCSIIHHLSWFG